MLKKEKLFIFTFLSVVFILKLVFILVFLGDSPSYLAPDEATFSSLILWVFQGNSPSTFPLTGGDLFFTSFSFSFPSLLLLHTGLDPLFATRFVSIIYSTLSIYVLYKCIVFYPNKSFRDCSYSKKEQNLIYITVFIFTFFPSVFLWSSVGLRESTNYFYLLLVFYFLIKFINSFQVKFILLFILGLTLLYFSRPETLQIMSLSFLPLIFKTKKNFYFLLLSILPILIFNISSQIENKIYNATTVNYSHNDFMPASISPDNKVSISPDNKVSISPDNKIVTFINESIIDGAKQLLSNFILINVSDLNKISYNLIELRQNKRLGAESAFPLYECPKIKISLFENLDYCVFYNLPKQLIDVVIYPIEIGTNQKWYKNLAAFENIIFNFLLFLSIFLVFRVKRFQESVKITVQMCMYFIVVSMFVFALVEGNYGTSYRHKLLILGPILILINLNLPKLKTNWDIH